MLPDKYQAFLFLLIGISMLCVQCDRKEGCLDPNATNYTIDAEINCCCEYPELRIEIGYLWDTLNIVLGDTLLNDLGVEIVNDNFAIYFSSFQFQDVNNNLVTVENQLNLGNDGIVDDIILVKRQVFSYTIGTLNQVDDLIMLEFQIGLPQELDEISVSDLSIGDNHPLNIQEDSLYRGAGLGYDEVLWEGSVQGTSIQMRARMNIPFEYNIVLDPALGSNIIIPIDIDFQSWFKGIMESVDEAELINAILGNIPGSITIRD